MVKKVKKKKKAPAKKPAPKIQKIIVKQAVPKEPRVDKILLENFVSLQRVMTNLSLKFDNLTTQISKLLELFEISAKAMAEKDFDLEKDNKDVIEKLDNLADQNKTIARGISLMHERLPQEDFGPPQQPTSIPLPQKMMPPIQQMPPRPMMKELPPMPPPKPKTSEFQMPKQIPTTKPSSLEIPETPKQPEFEMPQQTPPPRFESPMEK